MREYLFVSQCPRTSLNKRFLPRPKTITVWKLIPHRSKISETWNPLRFPLHRFFKNWFLLIQKQLYSNYIQSFHLGGFQFLLILDLLGKSFHTVLVFGLGKNILFKSFLGRCDKPILSECIYLHFYCWLQSTLPSHQKYRTTSKVYKRWMWAPPIIYCRLLDPWQMEVLKYKIWTP